MLRREDLSWPADCYREGTQQRQEGDSDARDRDRDTQGSRLHVRPQQHIIMFHRRVPAGTG